MNLNHHHTDDLDWLAFLYVANELDEPQREVFEERLALEQSAREAVARAVEISQTLAAVEDLAPAPARAQRAVSQSYGWSSPVAWMGVGAAACLAIVATWAFVLPGLQNNVPSVVKADLQLRDLARAWTSARQEYAAHEEVIWDRDLVQGRAASEGTSGNTISDEALDDLVASTPSWMLTAVAGELTAPEAPAKSGEIEKNNEIREN